MRSVFPKDWRSGLKDWKTTAASTARPPRFAPPMPSASTRTLPRCGSFRCRPAAIIPASRHRLRDWIILILRTAAVILVALAFARPLLGVKAAMGSEKPGKIARVVIVDQSLSTGARSSGVSAFERARAIAATHLTYQPDLR